MTDDDMKLQILNRWAIGESASQIAEVMNVTRNAVMGIVHRARSKDATIRHTPKPVVRQRQSHGVTLMELTAEQCHATLDARSDVYPHLTLYCAAEPCLHGVYCEYHYGLFRIKSRH